MLDLTDFCRTFGWGSKEEEYLAPRWEELCSNTTDDFPFFMEKEFYTRYGEIAHITDPEVYKRMKIVAQEVRTNKDLCRFANISHYAYFKAPIALSLQVLPSENKFLGENSGIFHLMVALSSIPCTVESFASMGIPEKYAYDKAEWIRGTIDIYAAAHNGIPGHTTGQTYWLREGMEGRIFRIGRFEYILSPWREEQPAVYVNRSDRSLCVLCRDQTKFDKDLCVIKGKTAEQPFFTARLKMLDHHVTGTPILPDGKPRPGRKVTLDLAQWEPLISPWDLVAEIHIPGGGNMSLPAVKESMKEAKAFFRKYFSVDVKAFICSSWILNPAWQKELPKSNLANFQRNIYLTSVVKGKTQGLFFVYGRYEGDPRQWERTSSLHEAFCRIFDRNESLAYGTMFFAAEDLDQFGTEYYRNKYCL